MLQLLTCTHLRDNILTEQQMMEDKIKATDWEATNEAIEEQVWSSTTLIQDLEIENLLFVSGCSGVVLAVVGGAGEAEEELKEPTGSDGDQRPGVAKGRLFFTKGRFQSS